MNSLYRQLNLPSLGKIVIIAILLLLFLLPLGMVEDLVLDRRDRARGVSQEVINGEGGTLDFIGPVFVVPYSFSELDYMGIARTKQGELYVLPDTFLANGVMEAEYRYRGIYRVPVYRTEFTFSGSASMPPLEAFPKDAIVFGNEVRMIIGVKDMRGIREATELVWSDGTHPFKPDVGNPSLGSGLSTDFLTLPSSGQTVDFSWTMEIDGGKSVSFLPLGRNSELFLRGDWASPSFKGARLPDERSWDSNGFEAQWRIPEVSRSIKPYWGSDDETRESLEVHSMSVELLEPVTYYQKAFRSVRYGILFLLIPFVVFLIFQLIGGINVHPIQYVLAGAANIVFYVLLLALSEHWGFNAAYFMAAAAVTSLLSLYSRSITRKRAGFVMLPVLIGAYLWLWTILQSEDYALLIGALGLFVILAMLMVFTRKVNLSESRTPAVEETSTPEMK